MDFCHVIILLLAFAATFATPASDPENKPLQQLQLNGKLKSIQQQISQLQAELKESDMETAIQPGPQTAGNPLKTEGSVAGAVKVVVDPHLAQVDSQDGNPGMAFIEGGMGQEEYVPRPVSREISWQPLKRRVVWQPMKKDIKWQPLKRNKEGTTFRLTMKTSQDLRDGMLQLVEQNLIKDLTAAQKYGIEP